MTEKLVFILQSDELMNLFIGWPEKVNLAVKFDETSDQTPFLLFRTEESEKQVPKFAEGFPIVPEFHDYPTTRLQFALETKLMELVQQETDLPKMAEEYSINFQTLIDNNVANVDDEFEDIGTAKSSDLTKAELNLLEEEVQIASENVIAAKVDIENQHTEDEEEVVVTRVRSKTSYQDTVSDDFYSSVEKTKSESSYNYGYPKTNSQIPVGFVKGSDLGQQTLKIKKLKGKFRLSFPGAEERFYDLRSEKFYRPDGLAVLIKKSSEAQPASQTIPTTDLSEKITSRIPNKGWTQLPYTETEDGVLIDFSELPRKAEKSSFVASTNILAIIGAISAIATAIIPFLYQFTRFIALIR